MKFLISPISLTVSNKSSYPSHCLMKQRFSYLLSRPHETEILGHFIRSTILLGEMNYLSSYLMIFRTPIINTVNPSKTGLFCSKILYRSKIVLSKTSFRSIFIFKSLTFFSNPTAHHFNVKPLNTRFAPQDPLSSFMPLTLWCFYTCDLTF